jgi:hypothetical protein
LVVGNGLTLDLIRDHLRWPKESWNTQQLLGWRIGTPGRPGVPFLYWTPRLDAKLLELKHLGRGFRFFGELARDFKSKKEEWRAVKELIEAERREGRPFNPLRDEAERRSAAWRRSEESALYELEAQTRHWIIMAYSHFQEQVNHCDLSNWKWVRWFREHREELVTAVSFNYDLVLERALAAAGIVIDGWQAEYRGHPREHIIGMGRRAQLGPDRDYPQGSALPLFKPHGSVDFEGTHSIHQDDPLFQLRSGTVYDIDLAPPLTRLFYTHLLQPRTYAQIVLPQEYSPIRNFAWVEPGYDHFKDVGPTLDRCIFVGLSYWRYDRAEINFLLKHLNDDAEVLVVNPKMSRTFATAVRRRGLACNEWDPSKEL